MPNEPLGYLTSETLKVVLARLYQELLDESADTDAERALNAAQETAIGNLATAVAAKASPADIAAAVAPLITETEADAKFLQAIPAQYVNETELGTALGPYVDSTELAAELAGYLTAVPPEYVTETELASAGLVKSVNGSGPDASGNVNVSTGGGSALPPNRRLLPAAYPDFTVALAAATWTRLATGSPLVNTPRILVPALGAPPSGLAWEIEVIGFLVVSGQPASNSSFKVGVQLDSGAMGSEDGGNIQLANAKDQVKFLAAVLSGFDPAVAHTVDFAAWSETALTYTFRGASKVRALARLVAA